MTAENMIGMIHQISSPKPETPAWLVWLLIGVAVAMIVGIEVLHSYTTYHTVRTAIQRIFRGEELDDVNIAFKGVQPEELCTPLSKNTLQRIRQCRNAAATVTLLSPPLFNVMRLEVRYDAQGTGADVHETAQLEVSFYHGRSIFAPVCIEGVSLITPDPEDAE